MSKQVKNMQIAALKSEFGSTRDFVVMGINKLDNIFLYDIDDLQQVVNANMQERQKEAQTAEQIASEEAEKFLSWLKTLDVVPTIVDLQSHLEHVRQQELARLASQLGIPQGEARAYINAYFEKYPGIRDYMERTKKEAHAQGYVTTVFGRPLKSRLS